MVAPSLLVSESRYNTVFPNNGGTKSVHYALSSSYKRFSQLRSYREHITHYKIRFSLHPQPIPTPPTSLATMPVFTSKATFFAEGVESCLELDEKHDCPICIEQLDETSPGPTQSANVYTSYRYTSVMSVPLGQHSVVVNVATTTSETDLQAEQHDDHTPIMMICCCNCVFGRHCLEVWLKSGNSCPNCRAELFPMNASMDRLVNRIEEAFTAAVLSMARRHMDEVVHQDISEHDEDESLDDGLHPIEVAGAIVRDDENMESRVGMTIEDYQAETLRQQRIEQAQLEARYDMARRYEARAEQAHESLRAEVELFYRLRPDLSLPGGVGQSIESLETNLEHIGRLYPEFFPHHGEDLNQAEDEDSSEAELAINYELAESLRLELEEVCRPLRSDLEHLRRHHPDLFLPNAEDLNQTEDEGSRRVEVEDLFEGLPNLFQPEDERSSGPEVEDLFEDIWTD